MHHRILFALLALASAAPAAPAVAQLAPAPAEALVVALDRGRIRGKEIEGAPPVRAFLGIPFAAPPVGPLRWRPPAPEPPWEGVRDCVEFSASCPQPPSAMGASGGGAGAQSEDCLHLNLWTAAARADARRPVMVWIHGGAFVMGSASGSAYDGANLARRGVVVVSINYRLGPFGFLAHPALSAESQDRVSGNYGLLDQVAALDWVRRNVSRFGGDPGCVTIFGESAGAFSVSALCVMPAAKGLFHRAIQQSGALYFLARGLRETRGLEEPAEATGEQIFAALGASGSDPLAAARAASAEEILRAARPGLPLGGERGPDAPRGFGPVMDGVVIPDWPAALFDEGRFHPVPLLLGTNADEGTIFTMPGARRARGQFAAELAASYGPLATRLLELYPVAEQENAGPASAAIFGDSVFVAPSRAQARAVADASVPCFLYQFTRVVGGRLRNALGAFHAAEIPYVFGNLGSGGFQRYEPADAALATTMQDCWIAFARSGDPNGEGRPAWPAYDAEEDSHLELDVTIRVGAGLRAAQCDFWDELLSAAVRRGR